MAARGRGFAQLTPVEEVLSFIMNKITAKLDEEKIPTSSANKRLLATDIFAPRDLPGFRRAAMDGFAVKGEDTFGASEQNPVQLQIIGHVEIGDTDDQLLTGGKAFRISTGAPLPEGADAVVKLEACEDLDNVVEIYLSVPKGKNVANIDEDVKAGRKIYNKGHSIRPFDIAQLESLVIPEITVISKPKVAVLSTGSELVASGVVPEKGQVVDSNRPAINAWIEELGGDIISSIHCIDDRDEITEQLTLMADNADLIISTGGTSVGTRDYLAELIESTGELWIHGLAIRPGKPVALGSIMGCPIIALPGYPLAAFINFHNLVAPIICRWTGYRLPWGRKQTITLAQQVPSSSGMRDFVRLKQTDKGAEIIRITGAGILSSLTQADYMLIIPENLEGYNAGDTVEAIILGEYSE